jgi:GTP cyclohydrolase FolE2
MVEIVCRTCGKDDFNNWGELANHKLDSKDKAHRKDKSGRIWAANYKYKHIIMKQNDKERYHTPLTDEDRIAKEDTRRELSGVSRIVATMCPRCKAGSRLTLETEHTDNPQAWRIGKCFVKLCNNCGGAK